MPNTITLHRVLRAPAERIYRAFLDPAAATQRYTALARDLRPNEYGDRVQLLKIHGDKTEILAETEAPTTDED